MVVLYKSHSISTILSQVPNSNKWRAKVIVQWDEGAIRRTQTFDSPLDDCGSDEKADLWAIGFVRKWIDDGKPDIELR